MKKHLTAFTLFISFAFTPLNANAIAPRITGPDMRIVNNNIIVNFLIHNISELETLIMSGVEKEVIFTVELLRVWKFWPDEFIVSKKLSRVIRYDNLREQYRVSYFDGVVRDEMHFRDYAAMRDWIFSVSNVNLANIRELEPGSYYIRTVVESRSLEQLPLIGFLMHFIPEVEMSLAKESPPFMVEGAQ